MNSVNSDQKVVTWKVATSETTLSVRNTEDPQLKSWTGETYKMFNVASLEFLIAIR